MSETRTAWVTHLGEVYTDDGEYVGEIQQTDFPGMWRAIPGQRRETFNPERPMFPERVLESFEAARAYLIDGVVAPPRTTDARREP